MIDKKDMSEEEIKLNYITPAITETWSKSCIRMEFPVTPGRIMLDGKKAKRKDAGIADYVLFYNDTSAWFPLAVVEAKDNNHSPYATGNSICQSNGCTICIFFQWRYICNARYENRCRN